MKFRDDLLRNYMNLAPMSLAFERILECKILEKLPFDRPILDLGCGEGLFAHVFFAEKIDTGIDPNPRELVRARQLGAYKELIQCSGSNIPKPDSSFRTVFSNSVLEHIQELEPVLDEVHRILAENGRFHFTVPSQNFERYAIISRLLRFIGLENLAVRYQKAYNSFWRQINCHDLERWKTLATSHGFQVVEAYTYNPSRICSLNDAMVPLSVPAFIIKKLSNRWVLFPSFKKFVIYPIYFLAKRFLRGGERAENGGLVFVTAVKGRNP